MKKFFILLAVFIIAIVTPSWGEEWSQFQFGPPHSGKTEVVASIDTLLWVRQISVISPFAGPAIDSASILVPTSNGLYLFSLDGGLLWCIPGSFENVPAILDSEVIVTSNIFLRAFSLSGDSLWRRTFRDQLWHPTIWSNYIFVTEGNRLWKIAANGDTVWSRQCSPGFYNAAPAVDDSGRIFVVTLGSTVSWFAFRIYGFNQNGDQIFFHEEWTMSEPGGNRVTPTLTPTGVVVATYPQSGWFHGCYLVYFSGGSRRWDGTMRYSSAACDVSRNRIYHIDGNTVVARDLAGSLVWRSPNLGEISYSSPAVDGEGKIFVGTDLGIFYVLNPDGTIRFRYDTGASILTHPAITSDGKVVIASTAGRLFCFDSHPVAIEESPPITQARLQSGCYDVMGRRLHILSRMMGVYFRVDGGGRIMKVVNPR